MRHFTKSVMVRIPVAAGLAIALALPLSRSAEAAQRAATAPGFTLSVVHEFPAGLGSTPKYPGGPAVNARQANIWRASVRVPRTVTPTAQAGAGQGAAWPPRSRCR